MKRLLLFAGLSALFAGCCSVERTSPGIMAKFDVAGSDLPAVETVAIRNSGWTVLYWIPGLFGDVTWDPSANGGRGDIDGGLWLLKDKCNVSDCYETLQKLAAQRNCDLTNVTLVDNSAITPGFGGGLADYVGWFVESNDVIVSGVLHPRASVAGK